MDITVLSSIILTITTGIYALLTFIMLNEQKKANHENFLFMQKQLDMLSMPIFHCSVKGDTFSNVISISNIGNVPVYQVEVFISCELSNEDMNINLITLNKAFAYNIDGDDFYHFEDYIYYPIFMHKNRVSFESAFPFSYDSFNILIQYSDMYGDYHTSFFWLFDDSYGERNYFQMGTVISGHLNKHKHINYRDIVNKDSLPEHIKNYVSLSENKKKYPYDSNTRIIEDRGEWTTI